MRTVAKLSWTPAQLDAINARNGSVLVSAAAGSGKTAVLVERVIQAVTDLDNSVSLDRMLIVTFTRDAKSEMCRRIDAALSKLLRKDPYNKHLLSQKQLLYSARISTIDSFCQDFVRQYFYKLGIRGDFRIADKGEQDILTERALDNTLEHFYQQGSKAFLDLVERTCSYRDDKNLRKHLISAFYFLESMPFPESWLDRIVSLYDVSRVRFEDTPYADYIFGYSSKCADYCLELNRVAAEYLAQDEVLEPAKLESIRTMLEGDRLFLEKVKACAEEKRWDDVTDALSGDFPRFPSIRNCPPESKKDIIKNTREIYKAEFSRLSALYFADSSSIADTTAKLRPVIKAFADCIIYLRKELMRLKSDRNILSFSDVEHLMIKLLCSEKDGDIVFTETSDEISKMFDLVMVDEFQDINESQDLLFRAICRDRNNLFVVGDVKQSIYGFRQAKPEIFINYKDSYKRYDRVLDNYPSKIILDRNFRSRKGITNACNFIFKTLMSPSVGGIEYTDEEKLVFAADYQDEEPHSTELMLIDVSDLDPEKNEEALEIEAAKIAERIHKLIFVEKMQVKDGNTLRNVTYGDIAVLLRSAKGYKRRAAAISRILREYAIPSFSDEKNNFFDEKEIKVMLNMLRIIDNPLQDIPLLSVLMSPMFGFTADDIASVRADNRRMPIYSAVKRAASSDEKCREFISFTERMRTLSVTTTVDRLIAEIMRSTVFDSVSVAKNGAAEGNLRLLRDYARSYAEKSYKTLTAFINYIDRMAESGTVLSSSDGTADNQLNAVRVMSIHSSKGLEFPVCFLSCTSTKFYMEDASGDLVLDSTNGFGFRYLDGLIKHDTAQRAALSYMVTDSKLSEEMRILYVALTRARERLIITSTQKKPLDYLSSLESRITSYPISPFVVRGFKSFSDWIFACALVNPKCDIVRSNPSPVLSDSFETDSWTFEIVPKNSAVEPGQTGDENHNTIAAEPDMGYLALLKERFAFRYPLEPLRRIPQKVSASELAHKDNRIFSRILRKPSFLSDEKPTGAEKGLAFHRFLEKCDFKTARADIRTEAERLVASRQLTEEQRDLLDTAKLEAFFAGSLVSRVLNSEGFFREYTFTVKIKASDFNPEIEPEVAEQELVMQGAVDLVFIENGSLVLVDYKTDRVGDVSALGAMYHRQLELYQNALEQIFQKPVTEKIIYSIHLGEQLNLS